MKIYGSTLKASFSELLYSFFSTLRQNEIHMYVAYWSKFCPYSVTLQWAEKMKHNNQQWYSTSSYISLLSIGRPFTLGLTSMRLNLNIFLCYFLRISSQNYICQCWNLLIRYLVSGLQNLKRFSLTHHYIYHCSFV